ncbi:MAG: hypothetical protein DPW18_11455 [Chloroflexi bacterium]|nr:hypothetical protein [Chloroflexota bacterium]MDL1944297.1 HAD family hydrolase [Chloroflexi bacterium CFX2]
MKRLNHFKAKAIIFDAMWGGWTLILAQRLTALSGIEMRPALCEAMGYDLEKRKVLSNGKLAATPMFKLYDLTVEVMTSKGLARAAAEKLVEEAWVIPEPVELAKPFTDLRQLFGKLHKEGIQIAIATADDRAPTQALIEAFDLEEFIFSMACADDGIPSKPAPDMVLTLCRRMNIDPAKVMVVGDTASDLKMARAAGAGLAVGVLSGVSNAGELAQYADVLIESVEELLFYSPHHASVSAEAGNLLSGLNPEIAA